MIGATLLLVGLGTALVVILALAWALRRLIGQLGWSRSPTSRAEYLLRSAAALLAAALAFLAAARVSVDSSYEFGGGIIVVLLAAGVAAAIVSAALVWSRTASPLVRLAGSISIACGLLLAALSPLAFARDACGCTTPAVPYVPPTLAGLDATAWAVISAVVSPGLLLVALVQTSAQGKTR